MRRPGHSCQNLFNADVDPPVGAEIVPVEEALGGPEPEARQRHRLGVLTKVQRADGRNSIAPSIDTEAVQVFVLPAPQHLATGGPPPRTWRHTAERTSRSYTFWCNV